tara:strand:- start:42 stop:230 length:189 start_codon:yes stop_codon:yes gene_type:complete
MQYVENIEIWEDIEDLIYEHCNKNSLNLDEYEHKYKIDLRKNIDISEIIKTINLLNKGVLIQ